MTNIAILGCGNIGGFIANAIYRGVIHCKLSKVFDENRKTAENFRKYVNIDFQVADSIEELMEGVDLVVETASQEAVREYGINILNAGKHLMVLSVGALADNELFRNMKKAARKNNVKIYVPSGGIIGIDGINAAKLASIESVEITTRKNPINLGVDVDRETLVFEGPASEGVMKFPRNVNVAATVGIAGIGMDRTDLRIIADPNIKRNIHEICVKGDFGEFTTITKNIPSTQNPKTSWIAALSAIAMLKEIFEVVQIGT